MNSNIKKIVIYGVNENKSDTQISTEIGISRQTLWHLKTNEKGIKFRDNTKEKINKFIEEKGL